MICVINSKIFSCLQSPIHISEDMSIASELITLTAADPDTRLRGKVTYTILDIAGASVSNDEEAFHCINESYGTFRINSYTGTLRVARKLAARCVYNVTVRAMDHGSPPLFSIISLLIETGNGNATALGIPTITAIVSQEGMHSFALSYLRRDNLQVKLQIVALILSPWNLPGIS